MTLRHENCWDVYAGREERPSSIKGGNKEGTQKEELGPPFLSSRKNSGIICWKVLAPQKESLLSPTLNFSPGMGLKIPSCQTLELLIYRKNKTCGWEKLNTWVNNLFGLLLEEVAQKRGVRITKQLQFQKSKTHNVVKLNTHYRFDQYWESIPITIKTTVTKCTKMFSFI